MTAARIIVYLLILFVWVMQEPDADDVIECPEWAQVEGATRD